MKKLVKITATWCISCILMNELLRKIEKEINPNYQVIDLDFDNDKDQFKKYDIGSILPVYILMDSNNQEVRRLTGEKSKQKLQAFLLEEGDENI